MGELLTIGQLADRAGLRSSALRYYDERGRVEPTTRIDGQRRYDPRVLRRLQIVEQCEQVGFTLSEIEQLLDGTGDWQPLVEANSTNSTSASPSYVKPESSCKRRSRATAPTSKAATTPPTGATRVIPAANLAEDAPSNAATSCRAP